MKLFNNKFKYGAYSAIITMVVVAILVVVNLVAGEFDYKIDLSNEGIFSLSEDTKNILKDKNEDISIYTLFSSKETSTVISRVEQVLEEYKLNNRNIHIENKDLYLYPDFAKNYQGTDAVVDQNSIIVQCGEKYKVIGYSDYFSSNGSLSLEEQVTSAIQYVTSDRTAVIYFITGHGEVDYSSFVNLEKELKLNNYTLEDLNLMEDDIPEDCTMVFVTPGVKDFTKEEAQKVKDYLTNDGRAVFMTSYLNQADFPNLYALVANYGVEPVEGYVLEGDETRYVQYPVAVIPDIAEDEITKNVTENNYRLLGYMSQALKEAEVKKQSLELKPLLTTSKDSYVKNNLETATSFNKEATDLTGPFNLAYKITDNTYTDTNHTTKVIVCGTFYMLSADIDGIVNNSGSGFILDAIKWLDDGSTNISVRSKSIVSENLVIPEGDKINIQIIAWGVIPGILFITGFIVWLRRRNG